MSKKLKSCEAEVCNNNTSNIWGRAYQVICQKFTKQEIVKKLTRIVCEICAYHQLNDPECMNGPEYNGSSEKCECGIAKWLEQEYKEKTNGPLTVGDLREIIKDLKDNTRIIVFSDEGTFSDEPRIYVDTNNAYKNKKVLIIQE